jgi:hypothetical protein
LAQHIWPNPNPSGKTITVDTSGRFNSVSFDNNGTIEITNDGTLTNRINGWLTNNAHSKINNAAGGTLENWGMLVNDWLAVMTNDGTYTNGLSMTNNATLTNNGTFTNDNATLTNNKTLENDYRLYNNAKGTLTNVGTLKNTWLLDNRHGGTLANSGTIEIAGGGTLTNDGTLTNTSTGMLINDGSLVNNADGTLINDGTIDTSQSVKGAAGFTNKGTYQGTGIVIGKWIDKGVIKPGNPPVNSAGVMTIVGDYIKVEGSHEIELGGLFDGGGDNAIAEFDRIDVTGNVELAGLGMTVRRRRAA